MLNPIDVQNRLVYIGIECEIEILLYKGNHITIPSYYHYHYEQSLLVPLLLPLPPPLTLLFYSGKYTYIYEYYNIESTNLLLLFCLADSSENALQAMMRP